MYKSHCLELCMYDIQFNSSRLIEAISNDCPMQMPNDIKDFTFDHSYWSSDSRDRHFATQEQVKISIHN